jgi:sporulation protein YqfC
MGKLNLWSQMELPGESLPGQVVVEIVGYDRVLIEHHRGVREYSRERIGVNVKFGVVTVCGTQLMLSCMNREQLVITGKIEGVMLSRRERR